MEIKNDKTCHRIKRFYAANGLTKKLQKFGLTPGTYSANLNHPECGCVLFTYNLFVLYCIKIVEICLALLY